MAWPGGYGEQPWPEPFSCYLFLGIREGGEAGRAGSSVPLDSCYSCNFFGSYLIIIWSLYWTSLYLVSSCGKRKQEAHWKGDWRPELGSQLFLGDLRCITSPLCTLIPYLLNRDARAGQYQIAYGWAVATVWDWWSRRRWESPFSLGSWEGFNPLWCDGFFPIKAKSGVFGVSLSSPVTSSQEKGCTPDILLSGLSAGSKTSRNHRELEANRIAQIGGVGPFV